MRLWSASVLALALLAGCVDLDLATTTDTSASGSTELLSIEPGMDARSLDGFEAIPGATVRYGEAALLIYRGDSPALVQIQLEATSAWKLASAEVVRVSPREVLPIAVELTLAEGDPAPGPAKLTASVVREPQPPVPAP